MAIEKFDHADYLQTEEEIAWALQIAFAEDPGDGSLFCETLGDIARARGLSSEELAARTGISAAEVSAALSGTASPSFATVFRLMKALHIKWCCAPNSEAGSEA